MLIDILNYYIKFFVIFTPFFGLSIFISLTAKMNLQAKQKLASKVAINVFLCCTIFYVLGKHIFQLFGITLDAFRIGAGVVLFLSSLDLINGVDKYSDKDSLGSKISIVPLTIPITVGPGVIGVLMVVSAEAKSISDHIMVAIALCLSAFSLWLLLFLSSKIQKLLGEEGILVLTKVIGLFVSAIAAQIVFSGVKAFLNL